MKNKIKTH